ncbi:Basic-leucine zipper domain protein [Kalmanozyma brasiliensis GHG001]|uniref:Basic-leucine zipper domain protein n=1 Tax=Kalmanozyma brasiliensis (strain GHG001) TaxID=1365824 RepID=UPI00286814F2|nr:Basic-leucine zipper domain protein [Kalmanozyma brasiliensis GHG001]EST09528.2 Basic-leucine zipper domain protein [Kalmanozyma brasiliensis GHG001]
MATTTTTSPSIAVPSSSRLPETPVKKEFPEATLAGSTSSSKKRKVTDAREDDGSDQSDDEELQDSSRSASPSKPTNTGGRRKASDEERKARLEARQARNRLSAQYSRERKKAYVDQLEGSLNALKAENTLLRQQREQEQLLRQALDTKLRDSQIRVHTLETILRTVAPSLVPLLASSSSSSSSIPISSSPAFAASSSSSIAPQLDAGLSADFATALLQNNVPAADVFTQFDGLATPQVSASGKVGSHVDVNGSSIVKQGYPLASQIHVPAPEQPSSTAASSHITLSQHPVEAKAAGTAREAEALLSNFLHLDDAKFAHDGDATTAAQDQGASTPAAPSQPVPVGQVNAEAASGTWRSAGASASDLASLSAASAGSCEAKSSSDSSKNINESANIFNTISLSHADSQDENTQARFQLLNSPLLPTDRNMWELATDAMLQDIYSNGDDVADLSVSSVSASDVSSEIDASAGSSPFDLVDLDIEIEEPLHLSIGLDEENMVVDGAFLPKADTAASMDWPGLMASLVA